MLAMDSIVPTGSVGTRPVNCTLGLIVVLDALKPTAMSPTLSMAMLPIQILVLPSAMVPDWNNTGVRGLRISYQRTPATELPLLTVCVATRDS